AIALFGEKYPNIVRVVDIGGPFSRELCGGTHVGASAEVGPISVLSEASVGSGVRRIEAAVGMDAFRSLAAERTIVSSLSEMLKVPGPDVTSRVSELMSRLKDAEKEISRLNSQQLLASAGKFLDTAETVGATLFVVAELGEVAAGGDVRTVVTDLRARVNERQAVVLGLGGSDGKPVVVMRTTQPAPPPRTPPRRAAPPDSRPVGSCPWPAASSAAEAAASPTSPRAAAATPQRFRPPSRPSRRPSSEFPPRPSPGPRHRLGADRGRGQRPRRHP